MKKLLAVILLALVLVAAVTGCGGAHRYDSRLTAADSLMQPNPDSALAIVEAIVLDSLPDEGNRAYRDLLLTQARYRCYITATSDSDINRALNYYRAHSSEREKLTRAYIYKGAVMDELGHPDSAMLYYKHAEATAAPDDYFNLGYAKMRMGALYRDNYSMDGKHIEKYEEALECFKHTDNTQYQLSCMINLGSLHKLKNPDKAKSILLSAKSHALEQEDTAAYIKCLQALSQTYYILGEFDEAKKLVKEVITRVDGGLGVEFCANAADIYARLGMPDSAELLLSSSGQKQFSNVLEELMYFESVGEIALARGDSLTHRVMENKCLQKQDSLQALDTSMKILQTEVSQDKKERQQTTKKHHRTNFWLILTLIALSISMILFYYNYHKVHRYDKLIEDLRETSTTHFDQLKKLQKNISDLGIRDKQLTDYVDSHLWLLRDVIEECYNVPNGKLVKKLKDIISFQEQNKEKWTNLYPYIDIRYNNILSDTMNRFPQLNEKDILLLALSTLDFSCVQIAMVMGYSNPTSVGVIRSRLAKKMGLNGTIIQYINDITSKRTDAPKCPQ